MRVSERGQITIPKKVREQFGLKENTEVEFVVCEGRVELRSSKESRREKVDALYGRKAFKYSTEELMRLLKSFFAAILCPGRGLFWPARP